MTIPISEVLEEAAREVEPKGPRPCDCDSCDCGNSGDLRAVAWWDEAAANADAIRALKGAYGDAILCEREVVTHVHDGDSLDPIPLYRAKQEITK